MNFDEIETVLGGRDDIRSPVHLSRYIKLMQHFVLNPENKDSLGSHEWHHIMPRKLWPEFEREQWNLILLPTKAHYLAHYLLFKAYSNKSCAFAFNQMRRVSKQNGVSNCRLYQAVRKEIAQHISNTNTGRMWTEEQKVKKSKLLRGTNVYRHQTTGELRRFTVGEQAADWESFQYGRKRTRESKNKMKRIMSNRRHQYNPETKELRFATSILPGFVEGTPNWVERSYDYLSELVWVYNAETGENKRVTIKAGIPDGFVEGRRFTNRGFQKINNPNLIKVVNLKTKVYQMIDRNDFDPTLHMLQGSALDKVVVYRYNDKIFTSYKSLISVNPELPEVDRNFALNERKIPKPHFNMTDARKKFCETNQGKPMNEVGLYAIRLLDYNYNKDEIYVESV